MVEVGMYVRTNKIGIQQIYNINNNATRYKYAYKLKNQDEDGCCGVFADEHIIKASHNIIDLIEVGDYVNGNIVIVKYELDEFSDGVLAHVVTITGKHIFEDDIKSIVTHEQFESMKYEVE